MSLLNQIIDLLPLLLPILLIDFAFKIYAVIDILKEDRRVKGDFSGNKIVWILVSVLINFGWAIYFLFGREEWFTQLKQKT